MLFAAVFVSLFCAGCRTANEGEKKFDRFFSLAPPRNEVEAAKLVEAGVTDLLVNNKKHHDLAKKYGMTPYWKCFTPAGPHRQVLTPEEEKYWAFISGQDLDRKMPRARRAQILHKRKIEKQHRYGGEMVAPIDVLSSPLPCFVSDEGLQLSRKKLDALIDSAPADSAGICLDFIGYMNHEGCYCDSCLAKYRKFLSERSLADTPENKVAFYRGKIVEYYDGIIGYIKSKRPDYKIVLHIYPDFKADPLYGNRLKAEWVGQTVAWYFKWDTEKIRKYTRFTVERAKDHYAFSEGIPFLGLNTNHSSSLGAKTPADVERELKTILDAGGRSLMVCCGMTIIEDGYLEVFKKYCGKK